MSKVVFLLLDANVPCPHTTGFTRWNHLPTAAKAVEDRRTRATSKVLAFELQRSSF
jgi:hypothetical protein